MINTVIFDMDGLLIDSEPLWGEAMTEVFATVGVALTPELASHTTGLRTAEVVDYWQNYFKWEGKDNLQVTNEIIDAVIAKIMAKGEAMEGLEYILEYFTQKNFKIGLASSSPLRLIESAVDHMGIRDRFQAISSAEFESHGKPHPAVYLTCAKKLGSSPLDCVAFEDSVTGMTAAKAARMKTVVVPEAHNRENKRYALADVQLGSLLDFNDAILQKLG
ncbi:hexitol phosphatase HxpB [Chitinophaga rhizophila]|uniref:Hexitol phosphatase HxpB n=1 Tax=Chitinophaga rhizophila TaxID=2866212 RepID=A0ABS7GBX9_9BACT|nr:hexitol phosphatase HxpB [Chitinophaga rhizophila]MBW8685181.1 hexitol phosphatase HxpB [Chitinophaga rhizophila]